MKVVYPSRVYSEFTKLQGWTVEKWQIIYLLAALPVLPWVSVDPILYSHSATLLLLYLSAPALLFQLYPI